MSTGLMNGFETTVEYQEYSEIEKRLSEKHTLKNHVLHLKRLLEAVRVCVTEFESVGWNGSYFNWEHGASLFYAEPEFSDAEHYELFSRYWGGDEPDFKGMLVELQRGIN